MIRARRAHGQGDEREDRMTHEDLHYLSLTALSALIQRREVSPVEVTRKLLARIDSLEPRLHAYATVTADLALAQAERAEAELKRGQWRGPLHGVPVAVKDLLDTKGHRTASGTKIMADRVPDSDATVVERLAQAGAVLLGKLELTEGAFADHHPEITPPVNPWSAAHWTGVSSSGSGVAAAAGLAFGTLGTDTGGSIRFPSLACGATGVKPTWGRVSRAGAFALANSLDHIGPITRSAADCAAILGAIAGPDPRDPTALRAPVPDYMAKLGGNGSLRGVKIGVDRNHALDGTEATVAEAFAAALDALADLGADIRDVTLPDHEELLGNWVAACSVETALAHEGTYPREANRYGPGLRNLIDMGRALSVVDYARIMDQRRAFAGELAAVFEDVAMLAIPASGRRIPRLDEMINGLSEPGALTRAIRFTAPFDFSGSPTISLPCGFDPDGVPLGFQLVGPHLSEDHLLTAGHAYQQVTDWHTRHPAI
jgi:amidase